MLLFQLFEYLGFNLNKFDESYSYSLSQYNPDPNINSNDKNPLSLFTSPKLSALDSSLKRITNWINAPNANEK